MSLPHVITAVLLVLSLLMPYAAILPPDTSVPGAGFAKDAEQWVWDFRKETGEPIFERMEGAGLYTNFYGLDAEAAYLRVYTAPGTDRITFIYMFSEYRADDSATEAFATLTEAALAASDLVTAPADRLRTREALVDIYNTPDNQLTLTGAGLQVIAQVGSGFDGMKTMTMLITPEPDSRMDGNCPAYSAWQTRAYSMLLREGYCLMTWDIPGLSGIALSSGEHYLEVLPLAGTGMHIGITVDRKAPHFVRGVYVNASLRGTPDALLRESSRAISLFDSLSRITETVYPHLQIAEMAEAVASLTGAMIEAGPDAEPGTYEMPGDGARPALRATLNPLPETEQGMGLQLEIRMEMGPS